jgi:hypothetical protein
MLTLHEEISTVIYHRVLRHAVSSSLAVGRTLLLMVVHAFAPTGTLIIGGDETIERRRGVLITVRTAANPALAGAAAARIRRSLQLYLPGFAGRSTAPD